MRIEKRGLIYCPAGEHDWEVNTFMTPHAMLFEDRIRIWGGVRDADGVSRIKYIDVDPDDPGKIIEVSNTPALDTGAPGCFDDNGVILGDIIQTNSELYLYYVGFQHVQKVKFHAFSGLAVSSDGGRSFVRYSEVPVLDRTTTGRYGRCIHTVIKENDVFKCWYAVINDWKVIGGVPYPVYNIWYTESPDGLHFPAKDSVLCVDTTGTEYRIGRPKVYKTDQGYEMYYTRDLINKDYLIGYAVSKDGVNWTRRDDLFSIPKSECGWDSEMACYPVKLPVKDRTYIFYGGNGMGKTGVGYAELITE